MTFMNANANIKQFQLIKFLNENVNDDHVISRISIVLRRDKLEAPYYMNTKIRLSSCLDNGEKGLIHGVPKKSGSFKRQRERALGSQEMDSLTANKRDRASMWHSPNVKVLTLFDAKS